MKEAYQKIQALSSKLSSSSLPVDNSNELQSVIKERNECQKKIQEFYLKVQELQASNSELRQQLEGYSHQKQEEFEQSFSYQKQEVE